LLLLLLPLLLLLLLLQYEYLQLCNCFFARRFIRPSFYPSSLSSAAAAAAAAAAAVRVPGPLQLPHRAAVLCERAVHVLSQHAQQHLLRGAAGERVSAGAAAAATRTTAEGAQASQVGHQQV
jgi:hypothetical protein